eukprot:scaffold107052_cov20-Tisochrysis_lutea.AAC.1
MVPQERPVQVGLKMPSRQSGRVHMHAHARTYHHTHMHTDTCACKQHTYVHTRASSIASISAVSLIEQLLLGLEPLKNLKILDVSNNRISKVEGLESQTQLEDLWLNDNGKEQGSPHCFGARESLSEATKPIPAE